ncbi:MAG: hypothetical protein IJW72_00240 [Alphaproteobacteria bacterium]|nr:hypothetical protein [Alphaproteobacteria bacterium]
MSKEKPEVGDVWEINGRKIRLEQVGEKYNKEYVYHISETSEGLKGYSIYTVSFIEADGKYLGKSKVSIKELFDVAED